MVTQNTGMDEFFHVLKDVRKVALVAAGGLLLLPLLAGLTGYAPPWPPGLEGTSAIVGLTSLMELVVLIVCFQILSRARRPVVNRTIIISAVTIVFFSIAYLLINSLFVFRIPNNPTSVVLGCGLSENAKSILNRQRPPPTDVCPGDFFPLLASAQYETDRVWTKTSVGLVKASLVISWLGAFGALASLTGVFVSFQRRQGKRARSAASQLPRSS